MAIHLSDLPFIAIIALGVFLPEIYLRMHLSLSKLMIIRMITLFATTILATYINCLIYPGSDPGIIFTRAFIFVGVSRMIMLSSHQFADRGGATNAGQ